MNTKQLRTSFVALAIAIAASHTSVVAAQPLASGSAYDVSIHLTIAGVAQFDVLPFDAVAFSNQSSAWSDSKQTVSADVGDALAHLTTGDLSVAGQWIPGTSFLIVGTQAHIDNIQLDVTASGPLLDISSQLVQTAAVIGGTCPSANVPSAHIASSVTPVSDYVFFDEFEARTLTSQGGIDVNGLSITTQGAPLLGLPTQPAPNTTITLPGGLGVLVLNETSVSGDGIAALTVSNNAVHLTLNAPGLLVGDVVIAHSDASIDCQ